MRKSCAEPGAARPGGLMVALTALMVVGSGAMAQDRPQPAPGAPVVLAPPKSLAPRPLGPAQRPVAPQSRPRSQDPAPGTPPRDG